MRKHLPIALLLAFTAAIFLATSIRPSLLDDADATHAEAAKEMIERDDWVTLHVNGVRYLEKAPMLYWAVAASFRVFGFNAFAVRFPIVLAIALLAFVAYRFGRWAYSERAGLYAAAILASCVGMFLFTRVMIPEALLTLWFTLAHYCFLRGFFGEGKEKRWYYGLYAAIALCVLTKGLIGIVFVAGPIGLFLLLTRTLLSEISHLRLGAGALLFLAIAAPWHLLAGFRNDRFFWFYFVNEHFKRFVGTREPKDYNRVPFVFYWLMHLLWLFPWSVAVPLLGSQKPAINRKAERERLINLYVWLWAALILVFFNISTSQEYYTFPVYAPLALLLGAAFTKAEESAQAQRYLLWAQGALAFVALIAASVLGALVWKARNIQPTGDLSDLLNQAPSDAEQYTLSLGHFFDLTTSAFAELRVPAIGAAISLGIGFLLAFLFRWRKRHARAAAAMFVTMGAMFVCANLAQQKFDPVLSSRALADGIQKRWEPNAKIVFNGEYETGSSIAFYTNKQVLLLNGKVTGMAFGSTYPDAPKIFLEAEDVRRLWQGSERIFFFTEDSKKERALKAIEGLAVYSLANRGGKSVLMNRP
ncbi:MAG: Undecaprenyl phosphate-alpha-4-amino-4-deoxy-L-arabinose arabinosyl transferase [Acidobacteria bacterium]|nr:Undecaprenyl phosphate-alpha-4-amino-4-deoxy-L-arabinose arabinosyl transferase [Acidobacteriota bacterium]